MSKQTKKQREAAIAAYNEVVANAELADISLISLNFFVKPEYYSAMSGDAEGRKVKLEFGDNFGAFFYKEDAAMLGGQFEWSIDANFGRKKLLNIKAEFLIAYRNVPNVGQSHMEAFVKRVGKFATYPYFRALVSQISWGSRVDLPVLPVLK